MFAAATFLTGGLAGIIGGVAILATSGAVTGAGSSLVLNPIQKLVTREHMTWSDTVKDVALGATIGGVTGPIGEFLILKLF